MTFMNEYIEGEEIITDVSKDKGKIHPNFIDWFEGRGYNATFYRFNKEQIQAIARRTYVPHQVKQHNERAEKEGWGERLDLEEELCLADKKVSDLFDSYTSIARGDYYAWGKSFDEVKDYDYVIRESSPFSFIAQKRFSGFVTKGVEFLLGGSFRFDERSMFISWNLDEAGQVSPSLDSTYNFRCKPIDEESLRKYIFENHESMLSLKRKVAPEKVRRKLESDRNNFGPEYPKNMSEDEYIKKEIAAEIGNVGHWVHVDRSMARKFGFIPFTDYVGLSGPGDLFDFVKRWTSFKEGGISFYRPGREPWITGYHSDNIDLAYGCSLKGLGDYLRSNSWKPTDSNVISADVEDWARSLGFEPRMKKRFD